METMNDFSDLQALWVSQEVSGTGFNEKEPVDSPLIARLKALQNRQDKINKIKIILIVTIMALLILSISGQSLPGISLYYAMAGLLVLASGIVVFFITYLKRQLKVSELPFDLPSIQFLDKTIERLNRQNDVFKRPFIAFIIVLILGLNLLYLGILPEMELMTRIGFHGLMSGMLIIAAFAGYRVRMYRNKKEVLPVIELLKEAKTNLNG